MSIATPSSKYKVYTLRNFTQIPQVSSSLSPTEMNTIRVVGNVLPFKANNYITEQLIDWSNLPEDPIYQLTFPQRGMLTNRHFKEMEEALSQCLSKSELHLRANKIRFELNPHPAGQMKNIPVLDGEKLGGIQHKYRETILFFP